MNREEKAFVKGEKVGISRGLIVWVLFMVGAIVLDFMSLTTIAGFTIMIFLTALVAFVLFTEHTFKFLYKHTSVNEGKQKSRILDWLKEVR